MCVHTLTLRLIKEKIRRNLRPYPSTLGWARRIGRVFGLTSRIDIDYIFDLANRRGRDVFFLQVGANDGLMDDPIHFLVRKYGWCGVLLDLYQPSNQVKQMYHQFSVYESGAR